MRIGGKGAGGRGQLEELVVLLAIWIVQHTLTTVAAGHRKEDTTVAISAAFVYGE